MLRLDTTNKENKDKHHSAQYMNAELVGREVLTTDDRFLSAKFKPLTGPAVALGIIRGISVNIMSYLNSLHTHSLSSKA